MAEDSAAVGVSLMMRRLACSAIATVVLTGCSVNNFDRSETTQPPDSWSGTAIIDTTVAAGPLLVRLESETCSAAGCDVSETVTNRSTSSATFNCSEQTAVTTTGKVVDQFWVTLGNGGGGCTWDYYEGATSPWDVPPGESRSFVAHFGTDGEGISRVVLPTGKAVQVPLITYSPATGGSTH